ncbi:3'-5' exonuclease [Candidatus Kapabacteria bacterium]|nr:3'-5' exonuclease [Candidatus Kapabacteria bacterium]
MYLFVDTETTGLPLKWNAPLKDLKNWPRLVQIAWLEYDKFGNLLTQGDYIITPKNFEIPEQSSRIHKITSKIAKERGNDLKAVLNVFNSIIEKSEFIVAHNIDFDEKIIGAEFLREYIKTDLHSKKLFCTMKSTVDFMKIPSSKGGFRYPGLGDLYRKLFGKSFADSHNALADIKSTAEIFWKLKADGVIDPNNDFNKPVKNDSVKETKDNGEASISLF